MDFFETAIIVVHLLVCLALIGLILLQQGKGAEAGASFGGGASQTVFGSQGSGNFLTRSTSWLAVVFFVTSISLAFVAKEKASVGGQENLIAVPETMQTAPDAGAEAGQTVAPEAPADVLPADGASADPDKVELE
jgi:preprotein translocase subunit SecG